MRQKCINMGLVLLGKEEPSKMRQKCVKNARNTFGGEHLLDDTEIDRGKSRKFCFFVTLDFLGEFLGGWLERMDCVFGGQASLVGAEPLHTPLP